MRSSSLWEKYGFIILCGIGLVGGMGVWVWVFEAASPPPPKVHPTGGLACAARFAVAPSPAKVAPAAGDAGVQPAPHADAAAAQARAQSLDAMTLAELLKATNHPGGDRELDESVTRRLYKKFRENTWAGLGPEERNVLAVELLDGEVDHGGFHQFFKSGAGNLSNDVAIALQALGTQDVSDLYRCALTAFPDSRPSPISDHRKRELAAWGDRQAHLFDRLDGAFFQAEPGFQAAVADYIRAHAADLGAPALRPVERIGGK